MGFLFSKFLWSSDPVGYDIPDANTGLTPRESDAVRNTWELVKKDIKGNGLDLFIKLFERHPDYQQMFSAFAAVPRDQLRSNGRLLGHATSVMYAITSIVDNLNDVECLKQLLHKIAVSHIPRKVHSVHFQNLAVVIVLLLEEKLGPRTMDEMTKAAWEKTLNTMNAIIASEMESNSKQR